MVFFVTVVVEYIKHHLQQLGMTQDALGKAVGVSRQSINSIERGRYIPSLELALKFAKVFNSQTDDLFQLQEEIDHD